MDNQDAETFVSAIKNYYSILGVVPTAEDIVIRAAYRALAQRYHPDRFNGSKDEANQRMAEINEAYAILSDPGKRKSYDNELKADTKGRYESEADQNRDDPLNDAIRDQDADWKIACKFYPDLQDTYDRLRKINSYLSSMFKVTMLDTKSYQMSEEIASEMEMRFLTRYFGDDKDILTFAKKLILAGNRDAAKALNDYVRVMGGGIEASAIIQTIAKEFRLATPPSKETWIRFLLDVRNGNDARVIEAVNEMPSLIHDARDSDGQTALHVAIKEKHSSITEFLLNNGANKNVKNAFNRTPIDYARENGWVWIN